ncbi:type II secretion system protein [Shimazuella kribbensis]|uniref:type II secretion system protein n=1 Tax=Shimazuella kribbensis TaxID=139808 RepID=UPI0003FDE981|nr:type II secretion system protein [Shimazuella kribbensis]
MSVKAKNESGFTLVELVCTISILGLLASLAIPNLSTIITKATDNQMKYQISTQLEDAQFLAMSKEQSVVVHFTNQQIITYANQKNQHVTQLPEDIVITSNYKNNKVVFQKSGQVRGGTIVFKRNKQEWMKVVIQVASGTTKVVFHV